MLKTLYSRLILRLIRPALERHLAEREQERENAINCFFLGDEVNPNHAKALEEQFAISRQQAERTSQC